MSLDLKEADNQVAKTFDYVIRCLQEHRDVLLGRPGSAGGTQPGMASWRKDRGVSATRLHEASAQANEAMASHEKAHDEQMQKTAFGADALALSAGDAGESAAAAAGRQQGEAYKREQLAARGIVDELLSPKHTTHCI